MSVIRVEKNKNYTTMSNYHFKEKEMSLKAKGLLSLMLSLPDNWDYTIAGLVSICKENDTAIKSALKELKNFGYLEIIKNKPTQENGGRIDYEYIIHEKPIQESKKQEIENQPLEILPLENQSQLNTNILNTKKENTYNIEYNVEKEKISKNDTILKENTKCIIDYLNESIGSNYRYDTKGTINLIKARFKEGYKLDDFYDVIDKKVKEWYNTEMQQYLRPCTLFGNKFETYLNQTYFKGKAKTSYSSKPTFDNTAGHVQVYHISDEEFNKLSFEEKLKEMEKFDAVADMTPVQKEFHSKYCLARDKDGNLIKF